MKERITAIALLVILLAGVVLGIASLFMKNNALGGTAILFIVAGVVGNYVMKRSREQRAAQEERLKQEWKSVNEGRDIETEQDDNGGDA